MLILHVSIVFWLRFQSQTESVRFENKDTESGTFGFWTYKCSRISGIFKEVLVLLRLWFLTCTDIMTQFVMFLLLYLSCDWKEWKESVKIAQKIEIKVGFQEKKAYRKCSVVKLLKKKVLIWIFVKCFCKRLSNFFAVFTGKEPDSKWLKIKTRRWKISNE